MIDRRVSFEIKRIFNLKYKNYLLLIEHAPSSSFEEFAAVLIPSLAKEGFN